MSELGLCGLANHGERRDPQEGKDGTGVFKIRHWSKEREYN